jgi:hypothetical protein
VRRGGVRREIRDTILRDVIALDTHRNSMEERHLVGFGPMGGRDRGN